MNSFRSLVYLTVGANATRVFCRGSGLVQGDLSPANRVVSSSPGLLVSLASPQSRSRANSLARKSLYHGVFTAMPVRLFLSYARYDDEPFVARLFASLKEAGFDAWFDRTSMPSRQLTFHQEIRDAVAACDRLILVVGPSAVTSDYVTQEWRFAYFEAVKCVNPIVRLDAVDAAGQKIDAYSLIPEDLRLTHAEDFRDDAQFDAHLANLIRQLNDSLPPAGKLVAVPELPPHYLDQPARIAALRDILLADLQKPVVVSGAAARVGLQGMGGIGKSVLASALAHRPEVRRAFPDGVYWVTLGQEPNVADLQRGLARALGDDGLYTGVVAGKEKLRELLCGRAVLLVLDDAWRRGHAEAFNVMGPRGRLLLTTRDAGLVTALAAKENHYQVQLPTAAEAEALLAKAAGVAVAELPAEARGVVNECGNLPLGLALCGGMVHGGRTWKDVLDALREHDLEYLSDSHPAEEQHRSILKAMDVSIRSLPEDERERFAELAVFTLDTGAPEAAVETLWGHTAGLTPRRARDLLMNFRQRSLIDFDQTTRQMTLHDLLHNFVTGMAAKRFDSLAALHHRLLGAYRKTCPGGWSSGPDDRYFLQNLVGHLLAAGETADAVALLTDLPWIETKCRARLVFDLQEDYRRTIEVLPEAQAELAEDRRRQDRMAKYTRDLIAYAKGEIGALEVPQSVELWSDERMEAESRRIRDKPTVLHKLRAFSSFVGGGIYPLAEFGARPGFVAQYAFNIAPAGPVHASGREFVRAVPRPLLLRTWPKDTEYTPKRALLRTLVGHLGHVHGLSVTPDEHRAVSGSEDRTVRVWDLETGACLRTLEGHSGRVNGVSITPDGRRAVSGSEDKTVRVWDLETGACLHVLLGHNHFVNCVSITPDARRAVSGGRDAAVRVWDLETGECLHILADPTVRIQPADAGPPYFVELVDWRSHPQGHAFTVRSVEVAPNGLRAVSGSEDGTIRVWDLEAGKSLRTIEVGLQQVSAVALTAGEARAVSGSSDRNLKVWDLETGACVRTLNRSTSEDVDSVSATPDGRRVVSGGSHVLHVWDVETGRCLLTLESFDSVSAVSVAPDGLRAVSASGAKLQVWNLEIGGGSGSAESHERWESGVILTESGLRGVSRGSKFGWRVWDLSTWTCLGSIDWQWDISSVDVTPDGRCAVSSGLWDRDLRVWDLATGNCLHRLKGNYRYFTPSVSVTADGLQAVSRGIGDGETGSVLVWDLASGQCLGTLEGRTPGVEAHPTRNGQHAWSYGDDMLRVWNVVTGLRVLESQTKSVVDVSVTADGRRVVSGSWDGTLQVWDSETGTCLQVLEGHAGQVTAVSVTSDGRYAVSGGRDCTLSVWNLETGGCEAIVFSSAPIISATIAESLNRVIVGTNVGGAAVYEVRGIALG